jgi:hypothetical protein
MNENFPSENGEISIELTARNSSGIADGVRTWCQGSETGALIEYEAAATKTMYERVFIAHGPMTKGDDILDRRPPIPNYGCQLQSVHASGHIDIGEY